MTSPTQRTIHVLRGPPHVYSRCDGELKWCFGCRERTQHHVAVYYDLEPSPYEPVAHWKCDKCRRCLTEFPG